MKPFYMFIPYILIYIFTYPDPDPPNLAVFPTRMVSFQSNHYHLSNLQKKVSASFQKDSNIFHFHPNVNLHLHKSSSSKFSSSPNSDGIVPIKLFQAVKKI